MSGIPNPFLKEQELSESSPFQTGNPGTSSPGFLLMTRAPVGANRYGGIRHSSPAHDTGAAGFIPFGESDTFQSPRQGRGRGCSPVRGNYGGKYNRFDPFRGHEGPRTMSHQNRSFFSPQQPQSLQNNHGFWSEDRNNYDRQNRGSNYNSAYRGNFCRTERGSNFNSPVRGRGNFQHSNNGFNVDAYISKNMVLDPWAEFGDLRKNLSKNIFNNSALLYDYDHAIDTSPSDSIRLDSSTKTNSSVCEANSKSGENIDNDPCCVINSDA